MAEGFGIDMLTSAIRGKPTIPDWFDISLGKEQTKAISANQASLPALENLASGVNSFNLSELTKSLETMIPGYNAITKGVTGNIESLMKGEIPKDVGDQIQQSDAVKALSGGYSGSSFHGNLLARDLGLTSLDLVGKGMSSAQSWIGLMGQLTQPSLFNLASMFITPEQQFNATMQNQEAKFQRDYVSNMNDWTHSFKYAAADDVGATMATVKNMALSYLGGMGGGGGMMGGKGGSSGGGTNGMNWSSFMGGNAEGRTVGG